MKTRELLILTAALAALARPAHAAPETEEPKAPEKATEAVGESVEKALEHVDDVLSGLRGLPGLRGPSATLLIRSRINLSRAVDVKLKDATVAQAAEALSQASGVSIDVDETVPRDLRLTVEARRVPLATVLEAVGKQTNLMISPAGRGVLLQPWPTLTVDGKTTQVATGRISPWSDDWGSPPTQVSGIWAANAPFPTPGPAPAELPFAYPPGTSAPATPARVALTTVGDRVVVAEPGDGPDGAEGVWLTVYQLERDQLKKVGSTFHPSPEGATRTRARAR